MGAAGDMFHSLGHIKRAPKSADPPGLDILAILFNPIPKGYAFTEWWLRLRWTRYALLAVISLVPGASTTCSLGSTPPVEIYHGLVYSCDALTEGPESGGLLHLVHADLNVPGVSLFISPLDNDAVSIGWQYRLRYVSTVVREHKLAAAVNGTLFQSEPRLIRTVGDLARSLETVVVDHVVNHIDANSYLLWWGDDLVAHLETSKPPSAKSLEKAKWAISGQMALLVDGKVSNWAGSAPDRRTLIAADPIKRLVWIAVFDKASYRFAAQTLADRGAKIAVMVDGGSSSGLAIGGDVRRLRPGTVTGNWRPVATVFGFRARKIAN
jgi:hypothetical protein